MTKEQQNTDQHRYAVSALSDDGMLTLLSTHATEGEARVEAGDRTLATGELIIVYQMIGTCQAVMTPKWTGAKAS